jgi:hypothetical protein
VGAQKNADVAEGVLKAVSKVLRCAAKPYTTCDSSYQEVQDDQITLKLMLCDEVNRNNNKIVLCVVVSLSIRMLTS